MVNIPCFGEFANLPMYLALEFLCLIECSCGYGGSCMRKAVSRVRADKFLLVQPLLAIVVLAALAGLFLMTSVTMGNPSVGGASTKRDVAIEHAMEYVPRNFRGLTSVELDEERIEESAGVWRLVFKCKRGGETGTGTGGDPVTLRLFVDGNSLRVWGSSTDGW